MGEVGSSYVTILPSFQGGGAKLASEVNPAVDKVGKDAGTRLSAGLRSTLALGAGVTAGAGVLSFLKDSIGEAREAQKVGAITEQTIKSTGGAAKITASQIGDLTTSISKKTGIDDEAIQSGANLLLTFTNVRNEVGAGNDIFSQATQTITDLSVAMGTDTKGAAIQLGKALNDPVKGITALTRVGVSFTQQQKDQIATLVQSGDVLGAQKIILAELNKEFGGVAAASATAGDKAAVAFGNLKETVGTALLPVLDGVAGVFTGVVAPAATVLVGVLTSIPGPVLLAAAAFGAFALLKGPISSFFETAGLKALYLKDSIAGLSFKGIASGLNKVLNVAGFIGATAAATNLVSALFNADGAFNDIRKSASALGNEVPTNIGKVTASLQEIVGKAQEGDIFSVVPTDANAAAAAVQGYTDTLGTNAKAMGATAAQQKALFLATLDYRGAVNAAGGDLNAPAVVAAGKTLISVYGEIDASSTKAADGTSKLTAADQAAADSAKAHADAVQGLKDTLDILNGGFIAAQKASIGYQQQLVQTAAASDGVAGANLAEQSSLLDLVTSGQSVISTMIDQGATSQDLVAKTNELRTNFITTATQLGLTGEEAAALADKMGLVPGDVSIQVSAPGVLPTTTNIQTLIATANMIPPGKTVNVGVIDGEARDKLMAMGYAVRTLPDGSVEVTANTGPAISAANGAVTTINGLTARIRVTTAGVGTQIGGNDIAVASGGYISGPGTATSDSINARLSNGEFVVRAAAVDRIGVQNLQRMNQTGRAPKRFAAGGPVATDGHVGGQFTGALVLDSGEFLGYVRGEVQASQDALGRKAASSRRR